MENKTIICIAIILIAFISVITVPHNILDVTDLNDYSDTAKFFAGEYRAKHRNTHSIFYGFMLSPYVKLTKSFFLLKLSSVFWLTLIILSIYYISGWNRKILLLFIASPLVWYLSPWLSPVPASAFIFLWAYHFISCFESTGRTKHIIYAGVLVGFASAFWDPSLYIGLFFLVSFLYDKKFYYVWVFLISFLIGLLPKLILDYAVFGFPFYGILKFLGALIAFGFFGGAYSQGYSSPGFLNFLESLIFLPILIYKLYKRQFLKIYKKATIFITLSLIFILLNPQPRPLFVILPIILLLIGKQITTKQFRMQITIFIVLSILVVIPYLIQSNYETNLIRFTLNPNAYKNFYITSDITDKNLINDLHEIESEYPNNLFLVGNDKDHYRKLAHLYFGSNIKEFVSIEDYMLYINNKTTIASKKFSSNANSNFRREIWIEVGLGKNRNDNTDYAAIEYAIIFGNQTNIPDFELIKSYRRLSLFKKIK